MLVDQVNGWIARQGSLLDFPLVLTSTSVICPDLVVLFSLLSFDSLGRVDSHDNGVVRQDVCFCQSDLVVDKACQFLTFLSRLLCFGQSCQLSFGLGLLLFRALSSLS